MVGGLISQMLFTSDLCMDAQTFQNNTGSGLHHLALLVLHFACIAPMRIYHVSPDYYINGTSYLLILLPFKHEIYGSIVMP